MANINIMPITQGGGGSPLREEGYRREQSATASALGAAGVQTARIQERGQTERAAMERDVNMKALQMQQQQAAWQVRTKTEERDLQKYLSGMDDSYRNRSLTVRETMAREALTKDEKLRMLQLQYQENARQESHALELGKVLMFWKIMRGKASASGMSEEQIDRRMPSPDKVQADAAKRVADAIAPRVVDLSDDAIKAYGDDRMKTVREANDKLGARTGGGAYKEISENLAKADMAHPENHPLVLAGVMSPEELRKVSMIMAGGASADDPRTMAPIVKKYIGGMQALKTDLERRLAEEQAIASEVKSAGKKASPYTKPQESTLDDDLRTAASGLLPPGVYNPDEPPASPGPARPGGGGSGSRHTGKRIRDLEEAVRVVNLQMERIREFRNMPTDPNNPSSKMMWASGSEGSYQDFFEFVQANGIDVKNPEQVKAAAVAQLQKAADLGNKEAEELAKILDPTGKYRLSGFGAEGAEPSVNWGAF